MDKMVDGIRSRRKRDGTWSHQAYARVTGHKTLTKTFPNKTAAKLWRKETEVAMRQGKTFMSQKEQKRTVTDVIDRYLERDLKPGNSQYKTKIGHLRWWKNEIGHIPLLKLSRAMLIESREKLMNEVSSGKQKTPATVNRYVSTLSTLLNIAAREWEWICIATI